MIEIAEGEVLEPLPKSDGPFQAADMTILEENQRLRRMFINELTKNGIKMPDDPKDRAMVAALLDSSDVQLLQKARVKIAAKTEETMGNLADVAKTAILAHRSNRQKGTEKPRMTELPKEIQIKDPVPGEMDVGVINLSIKDLKAE